MPFITKTDHKLLRDHNVQIDVDAKDKCGLISIHDQHYKITLLTLTNGDAPTWQTKQLDKEHMKNTAKKVAVMLLKKELLQQSTTGALAECRIHDNGITTYSPDQTTIKHYNKDRTKNTRQDYDALMNYLFTETFDTLDNTPEESMSVVDHSDSDSVVDDYLNRENIEDETENENNSHTPSVSFCEKRGAASVILSKRSSPAKKSFQLKIKKKVIYKKPLEKVQKTKIRKKDFETKQMQEKSDSEETLRGLFEKYIAHQASHSNGNDFIHPSNRQNPNDSTLITTHSIPRTPRMINPSAMNHFSRMYGNLCNPFFKYPPNLFPLNMVQFMRAASTTNAVPPTTKQPHPDELALTTIPKKRKKKSETLVGSGSAFIENLKNWESLEDRELANKLIRQYQQANRPTIPKMPIKLYTPPARYPTIPQPHHPSYNSPLLNNFPKNSKAAVFKVVLTAVNALK